MAFVEPHCPWGANWGKARTNRIIPARRMPMLSDCPHARDLQFTRSSPNIGSYDGSIVLRPMGTTGFLVGKLIL